MDDRVGPLPVWGWLVIVAGAAAAWYFGRPKAAPAAAVALGVSTPFGAPAGGAFLMPNGSGGTASPTGPGSIVTLSPASPVAVVPAAAVVSSPFGDNQAHAFNQGAPVGFAPSVAAKALPSDPDPRTIHPAMVAAGPGGVPVAVYGNQWLDDPRQAQANLTTVFAGLSGLRR